MGFASAFSALTALVQAAEEFDNQRDHREHGEDTRHALSEQLDRCIYRFVHRFAPLSSHKEP